MRTSARHGRDSNDPWAFPRARYLSQQFVEELCSSRGASEGLVREIERVIFEAHPHDEREGAANFGQLRERRTLPFQQARKREAEAIAAMSERIAEELEKEGLVTTLDKQVVQKRGLIAGYNADLAKLVVKGTEVQAARHAALNLAAQAVNAKVQAFATQRRVFTAMQDEVRSLRATKAPEMLREAQARHFGSGLDAKQWDDFLLIYKGDVDAALSGYIVWADQQIASLTGTPPTPGDPNTPLIADTTDLSAVQLSTIKAEMTRLEQFISADQVVRGQYAALSKRIGQENGELEALAARLLDAQGAAARRRALQSDREAAYGRVFQAIVDEQAALAALYAPLMARLAAASGTLRKLSFSVSRVVNLEAWGSEAEEHLIDRRKAGPFQGRGALTSVAASVLKPAWPVGHRLGRAAGDDGLHRPVHTRSSGQRTLCADPTVGVPRSVQALRPPAVRHRAHRGSL